MEFRVSLDERDDPDEEQETTVTGLPFVVSNDIIDSYDERYNIAVNEQGMPEVKAAGT